MFFSLYISPIALELSISAYGVISIIVIIIPMYGIKSKSVIMKFTTINII